MSYGRTLKIVAGGVTLIDMQGVREDVQNVRFEIHQQTLQSPNNAIVRVFNPSPNTAHSVPDGLKTKGMLEIYAGYADGSSGLVFKGDIVQRRIGKENPVTTYVEIRAKDGDSAYNNAKVNTTIPKGKTPQAHVEAALGALQGHGVTMGYVTPGLLSAPQYPRAVALFSLARDVLRNVAASGKANWSIQNGELQIVRRDDSVPGAITINAQTGMIGLPIETPNGIIVRALLDARVKVNSTIKINEADIQRAGLDLSYTGTELQRGALQTLSTGDGTYKVLCVNRTGASRELDFYNEIICIGTTGTAAAQKEFPDFNGGTAPAPAPAAQPAAPATAAAAPNFNAGNPPATTNPYGNLSGVRF